MTTKAESPKIKALKAAFPYTLPVLTGFLVLGAAYGILMSSKGYGSFWPALVSLFVFAGSMQFVAAGMLPEAPAVFPGGSAAFAAGPESFAAGPEFFSAVFLMTLMVNARHLFYGLSLLEKYRGAGWMKPYLIFGLCDETYSILCGAEPPEGTDRRWFMFFVTLLNQLYWVAGSAIGGFLGGVIPFDITGLDFALTALFAVIFIGQWQEGKSRPAAFTGIAAAVLCLILFGPGGFLIPAMLLILLSVTLLRPFLARKAEQPPKTGKPPKEEQSRREEQSP